MRIISICLLLSTAVFAELYAQRPMTMKQVAPGTYIIAGPPDGNILVIEGTRHLVLVDAQVVERVAAADSLLRRTSTKPVATVVNTHYHYDHIGGNAFYRARGARIVAHNSVPLEAMRDTFIPERKWQRKAASSDALPTLPFTDSMRIDIDNEVIHVIHLAAHTGGDAMVWIPSRNVMHVGDIVEIGAAPFIDWWAGGTLDGMLDAVDYFLGLANDSTVIVPGHGPPITRAMLRTYRMQLAAAAAACSNVSKITYACKPPAVGVNATTKSADTSTPEGIIGALYEVISGPRHAQRDWQRFRNLFARDARLIRIDRNRQGAERIITMTPGDYIGGTGAWLVENGFFEKELSRKAETIGSVYHVFSAYESRVPPPAGRDRKGIVARGTNSSQLINDGSRWWIVSLAWANEPN